MTELNEVALETVDLTLGGLKAHYQQGEFTPRALIKSLLKANAELNQANPAWIYLLNEAEVEPYLKNLEGQSPDTLPLYGVPFAIKDNIDLAGIPTTAACPAFAYTPEASAFVVRQLLAAGAIPLGKTNLDQFATGLVGVRSPESWGPCHNTLNEDYISGGSSSGSAVVVAKGLASFSLGTDTAGSGRIPASLNNLVGLKPSKGLLSTRGLVPACRSLDCISIFAFSSEDANTVFDLACQFDPEDAYARSNPYENGPRYSFAKSSAKTNVFTEPNVTLGVPSADQLQFFGNREAEQLFQQSLQQLRDAGATLVEIDFSPFSEAARLLYEGPWVTERYLATKNIIEQQPEAMLPVIQEIIEKGATPSAQDAFSAQYRLQALAQKALAELNKADAIVTPTAGSLYKVNEVLANPIQLNSNLGYYTNFMNLLDCAAVAVPSGFYDCGVGFGVTLFSRAFSDKRLLSMAAALEQHNSLTLGATGRPFSAKEHTNTRVSPTTINVVVCGAHLEGLPLNWQLQERGATLLEKTTSSPDYQLYALAGGPPFRPAMIRVAESGRAIEVEVWQVPVQHFGSFVAEIPGPLGIGKVQLADGRWESGFICEGSGIEGAKDITELGGWRAYLATK